MRPLTLTTRGCSLSPVVQNPVHVSKDTSPTLAPAFTVLRKSDLEIMEMPKDPEIPDNIHQTWRSMMLKA